MHTWRNGGWLNEAWQNRHPPPGKGSKRGNKDLMRRRLFLPGLPDEVKRALELARLQARAQHSPWDGAPRVAAPRAAAPSVTPTRPAYVSPIPSPPPAPSPAPAPFARASSRGLRVPNLSTGQPHFVLGALLFLVPPVGLLSMWSDARYRSDAKLALTAMTGLWLCLVTLFAIAVAVG